MRVRVILPLLFVLILSCGKEEAVTDSATRPDEPAIKPNTTTTATPTYFIDVVIRGVTTFYLPQDRNGNYLKPTLVVVKDTQHESRLVLPAMQSMELNNAIGTNDCTGAACELKDVGIRITDGGTTLSGFTITDTNFDKSVLHLSKINPKFNDFVDDAKDLDKPPTANGAVLAYLDLRGAEVVSVSHFACPAHFDVSVCRVSDITPQPFASEVRVRFGKLKKPTLQFMTSSGTKTVNFLNSAANGVITISNLGAMDGHMDLFSNLSKSKACLPKAITDGCNPGYDYVPGCGNTQWP